MKIFLRLMFLTLFITFFVDSAYIDAEDGDVKHCQYNSKIEMALYFHKQKNYEEALRQFEGADKLLGKPATKFFIGRTLFKMNKFKEAEAVLNEAIVLYLQGKTVDEFYSETFVVKAELSEMKGDIEGAISYLTHAFFSLNTVERKLAMLEGISALQKALQKRVSV